MCHRIAATIFAAITFFGTTPAIEVPTQKTGAASGPSTQCTGDFNYDVTLFSHAGEDQFDDWYDFYEATGGRATIAMDGLSQFKSTGVSKRPAVRSFGTPPPPIVCHLEH